MVQDIGVELGNQGVRISCVGLVTAKSRPGYPWLRYIRDGAMPFGEYKQVVQEIQLPKGS